MNLAVKWALAATLFMGIGYPILKVGQNAGVNPSWLLFINGFSCFVIGLFGFKIFDYSTLRPPVFAVLIVLAATLITNIGFILAMHALSVRGGLVSIVYVVTSSAPLITVLIGLIFLHEANEIIIPKLIFGALSILVGVFFVSNSIK